MIPVDANALYASSRKGLTSRFHLHEGLSRTVRAAIPLPRFQARAISATEDMVTRVVVMSPRVVRMVRSIASIAKTARGRLSFSVTVHTSPSYAFASI